jgi:mannose/fructose/N-acetylgalactosamine-specific phosphotransferase system component IID
MKTKKQNILDLVMYSLFLIFFIYWFIKDDMPSTYLWILIIVYASIIAYKLKTIFTSKK